MLSPSKKYALQAALPRLYENNYQALLDLIPNLQHIQHKEQRHLNDLEHLNITIQEQCRYTTITEIKHIFNNALIPDLSMTIRAYHDAKMAEVISYQHHRHFKPSYDYPNPLMYQPLEKRQINLIFDDWLKHCCEILQRQRLQTL